jgi:diacylglycerol kinase family enzyme
LIADHGYDEIAGIAAVAVLNGAWFGGGIKAAPDSGAGDDKFDIAVLPGDRKPRLRQLFRKLHDGQAAEMRHRRSARLTAAPTLETHKPVMVETDGEAVGMLPASFDILPNAIRIRI